MKNTAHCQTYTDEQLRILRHMLGVDDRRNKVRPYRDYYCANPGDEALVELARIGAVSRYAERYGYHWYRTTDQGKAAGIASAEARVLTPAKRRYMDFLDAKDACPDLTFKAFLTGRSSHEPDRPACGSEGDY